MTQPAQMGVIYLNETNHVLAAVRHSAAVPDLAALAGSDGLHVAGMRGLLAPHVIEYGAPTSLEETFIIPIAQLSQKQLPFNADVFANTHAYLVDATTVTKLPPPTDYRNVRIELTQVAVIIESTDPAHPNILSFPVATKVFIQIEGPDSTDRRVIRGVFPQNAPNSFQFPITAEPGGPLAPIAPGRRYFILVMIEGQAPDARTKTLL
jgi:hypothetical protein